MVLVVVVRCARIVFPLQLVPVAPFLNKREILALCKPARPLPSTLPGHRTGDYWVRVNCSASDRCLRYLCALSTPSHQVGLTSLPSASSLLLTCLLTCTDQLYQQLEQNRRLTNQLKLALNED